MEANVPGRDVENHFGSEARTGHRRTVFGVMLGGMGFEVSVDAVLLSSPKGHVLDVLGDHFEAIAHAPGSKSLTVTEHISMNDEDDAKAFVQSLVAEALPEGAKIVAVRAIPDAVG